MSSAGVVIREATSDDARAIAEVHVASWRWAYRGDLPAEFLDGLTVDDREREWREWLTPEQGAGTLVALEGGVIGFCSFGPSRDYDADQLHLPRSADLPAGRGRRPRIGRDLFASANDRLRATRAPGRRR